MQAAQEELKANNGMNDLVANESDNEHSGRLNDHHCFNGRPASGRQQYGILCVLSHPHQELHTDSQIQPYRNLQPYIWQNV
jgi:hypothetical protein